MAWQSRKRTYADGSNTDAEIEGLTVGKAGQLEEVRAEAKHEDDTWS